MCGCREYRRAKATPLGPHAPRPSLICRGRGRNHHSQALRTPAPSRAHTRGPPNPLAFLTQVYAAAAEVIAAVADHLKGGVGVGVGNGK